MASTTRRYMFDSLQASAEALVIVLEDARVTKSFYRFSGLTPQMVNASGLLIEGEQEEVQAKLEAIVGSISYED